MRYLDAILSTVSADEAIAECKRHQITVQVREGDRALVDSETGELIAAADAAGDYSGEAVIGYLGY
jgi:hypothetical protein